MLRYRSEGREFVRNFQDRRKGSDAREAKNGVDSLMGGTVRSSVEDDDGRSLISSSPIRFIVWA